MKQSGMVLISVLIFMSLISMLVVLGLESSELEMRMSQNRRLQMQTLQVANVGLDAAYQTLKLDNIACQIPVVTDDNLAQRSKSWWYSNATCHGSFANQNYYYVVEPLQINPCLTIDDSDAVQYWRVTVRAENNNNVAAILQSTVVLPVQSVQRCMVEKRALTSGLQSWRRL